MACRREAIDRWLRLQVRKARYDQIAAYAVVELPGGSAGLPKPGLAVCHQVTTLDRAKLTRKAGALPFELLREVEDALKAAMDLD